jgi:hypothetical protein
MASLNPQSVSRLSGGDGHVAPGLVLAPHHDEHHQPPPPPPRIQQQNAFSSSFDTYSPAAGNVNGVDSPPPVIGPYPSYSMGPMEILLVLLLALLWLYAARRFYTVWSTVLNFTMVADYAQEPKGEIGG